MIGELPKSLVVNSVEHPIRTDFRDILKIVCAFNDPELSAEEKIYICLFILYEDFETLQQSEYEEAYKSAVQFIDRSSKDEKPHNSPAIMDWEQDEAVMFPAINKVAGFETRSAEYIHWWTFLGYYMEISEGVFSNVLSLRLKKAKKKKLEKWEREYWNANKDICVIRPKLTAEEQEKKDKLNALLK